MTGARSIVETIFRLEAEVDQWDVPPDLAMLVKDADGDYSIKSFNVPGHVWEAARHPVGVIQAITDVITQVGVFPSAMTPPPGTQFAGVVLFVEGWGLRANLNDDPEALARALAFTDAGGRIVDHPDRVEVKIATAATDDGNFGMDWERDHGMVTRPGDGTEEGNHFGGFVMDKLVELYTALKKGLPVDPAV